MSTGIVSFEIFLAVDNVAALTRYQAAPLYMLLHDMQLPKEDGEENAAFVDFRKPSTLHEFFRLGLIVQRDLAGKIPDGKVTPHEKTARGAA